MKSVLRATALLSGSSVITILVGLVSAKAWAVLLGAENLGHMGLLQSIVGLAGLLAGTGIGTAVVRMVANALGRQALDEVAALQRAAWVLCLGFASVAVIMMVTFQSQIAALMLGSSTYGWAVMLMVVPLVLNLISGLQVSIVNSYHRVEALARLNVVTALTSTPIGLLCVWLWGAEGIIAAIISQAVVGIITSTLTLVSAKRQHLPKPSYRQSINASQKILRFAGPYTLSMLVGTGMQQMIPAMVLHNLNAESVGYFRAASAISVTYLGFLLNAMYMDYYPRLSSISHDNAKMNSIINQQHRFLLLICVPLVLVTLTVAPVLVPVIYTPSFSPAIEILRWQLLGDVFKFSSWTIGTAVVARSNSLTLFVVELIAGVNILLGTWFGITFFGLAGIGVGYLFTYIIHYVVVHVVMRLETGFVVSFVNVRMLVAATGFSLFIIVLPCFTTQMVSMIVAVITSVIVGLGCCLAVWQEVGSEKHRELTLT